MPDATTPLAPTTPYRCLRCGSWTTLDTPCCCAPILEERQGLDLPSFLAGGLVFTALFLLVRLAWWLVR
ncbi:MAG TPA: hypothetical protein VF077_12335 [Nitrospiraceae bacterium]